MEKIKILVVDDNQGHRDYLIEGLINYGCKKENISGVETGEKAVELVKLNPDYFDVAVIDHKLANGSMDGISTTKEICHNSLKIFPIIFTNIPSNNPAKIENYKAFAYKAGAYRYMYRSGTNDAGIVKDFISEIMQLSQLKERVIKFYESQRNVPSLLTQLDIMISLVDRGFKVWYMNDANKRFQKVSDFSRGSCAMVFLGQKKIGPCKGCIVAKTLNDGKNYERIYLHPFRGLGDTLKWIYSWTQPMPDENGKPILLEDGRPIAVLESAQDLSDSVRLRTMPTEERLEYIALSLFEREDGFDRVRIYKADSQEKNLALVASAGYSNKMRESAFIDINNFPDIRKSIAYFIKNGEGLFHEKEGNPDPLNPEEKMEKFIHWPLMKGERLVGFMSVNCVEGGRTCGEDNVSILKDYAVEALIAFDTVYTEKEDPELEKMISSLDNILSQKLTPEDTLRTLVDEVYRLTESDEVHIRCRDESQNLARLIPIGKGEYNEVAPLEVPLTKLNLPSVRVIIRGTREVKNNARNDPGVKEFADTLEPEPAKPLIKIGSYCVEPLIFQNRCIGSLTLFKYKSDHYDQKKVKITRGVAERIALAVRDYQVNIDLMRKEYAFESSINAVAFADMEGRVNYMNQSFLNLWGYTNRKEALGKIIAEFFKNRNDVETVTEKLKSGKNWIGELAAIRKDGTSIDVQLSASLVRDRSGKPIGTMASFVDITERKRLEKVRESIYQISEKASSVENLDDLFQIIHEIIKQLIPADNFYIAIYDEKSEIVSFPYFVDSQEAKPEPRTLRKGMTEYVIGKGSPILATQRDIKELAAKSEIEIIGPIPHYWIGVPLKTIDNKTIGVLAVQIYDEGQIFTDDDKNILEFVSTQVAMAIERKRDEQRKQVMLEEIHHRVKNNFSFISSLLDFQCRRISDTGIKDQFRMAQDRIHLMAMVHDKLYRSHDLSEIDFQKYVNGLVNYLFHSYEIQENWISLDVNIENISIGMDKAIPCGLIINELVTNSFKYAFPQYRVRKDGLKNIISITFSPLDKGIVILKVKDNGKGLPKKVNFHKTDSLGIKLIRMQVQQIDGTIKVDGSDGTEVIITFSG